MFLWECFPEKHEGKEMNGIENALFNDMFWRV